MVDGVVARKLGPKLAGWRWCCQCGAAALLWFTIFSVCPFSFPPANCLFGYLLFYLLFFFIFFFLCLEAANLHTIYGLPFTTTTNNSWANIKSPKKIFKYFRNASRAQRNYQYKYKVIYWHMGKMKKKKKRPFPCWPNKRLRQRTCFHKFEASAS